MNPKLKLLAVVLLSTSMIIFPNPYIIVAVAALTVIFILVYRLHNKFAPWIKPLILVFLIVILLHTFAFNTLIFSIRGFYDGILFSMRIFSLLAIVFVFVETTPMSGLADAFDFLPGSLPAVLVLALSLVPGITALSGKIISAQKARGLNFRTVNIFRTYFPVMVPLFAKTLYTSEKMALAMQARGFDG